MKSGLIILAMVISVSSMADTEKRKVASVKSEEKVEQGGWANKLRSSLGSDFKGLGR